MFAILFAVFFVVNLSFAQDPVVTEEHVGDAGEHCELKIILEYIIFILNIKRNGGI